MAILRVFSPLSVKPKQIQDGANDDHVLLEAPPINSQKRKQEKAGPFPNPAFPICLYFVRWPNSLYYSTSKSNSVKPLGVCVPDESYPMAVQYQVPVGMLCHVGSSMGNRLRVRSGCVMTVSNPRDPTWAI